MTYKEAIKQRCDELSKDKMSRFIGYNTSHGSRMYGTLNDIPIEQCIETPVAENLMMGLAMGMSLEGFKPVVCFERHDFMLLALDAIVNHLDKLPWMSGDRFKFPVLIRAIVGSKKPIHAGPQHTQEYSAVLQEMLEHTPVLMPTTQEELHHAWEQVGKTNSGAVVVIEKRAWYEDQMPLVKEDT